jgi:cellulose biosynthesis protein BcsQ
MAKGGGRGWFHRRKPRPEPEPAREPEPTRLEAYEAQQANQQPAQSASVASSPVMSEFDALLRPPTEGPKDPERPMPSSAGEGTVSEPSSRAASELRLADDRDERFAPPAASATAPDSPMPPAAATAPGGAAVASASFDWDAATAAALSDDPTHEPITGSTPTFVRSDPDRLLEDIIREIVGDATAETVSSLHQPRPVSSVSPESRADSVQNSSHTTEPSTPAVTGDEERDRGDESGETYTVFDEPVVDPDSPVGPDSPVSPPPPSPVPQSIPAAEPVVALAYAPSPTQATVVAEPPADVSRETPHPPGGTPLADQLADETRRRLALDEAELPLPPSTRIFTISNQKGGVGKTTSAVNLSAALARAGAHVLVVDLDPQGNASTALGVEHRSDQQSVYEVLVNDLALSEVIRPSTEHENLDCVPATIHLAGAEIELVSLVAREQRLRRALDAHLADMEKPYDYVFIDCPPSLGLLTINAFVAAREVLIPIQCEYYALEGLSQLLSNIELIEKHLNSDLRLTTILLTMYDSRTNLAQQVAQEVRDHFPTQTLETIIPRSVRVSEAPSYGQSVISYDFTSSGSLSYREAAAEIAWRGASEQKETD